MKRNALLDINADKPVLPHCNYSLNKHKSTVSHSGRTALHFYTAVL